MNISRRGFLGGLAGIMAAGVAPAIVTQPMKIFVPKQQALSFNISGNAVTYSIDSMSYFVGDFDGDSFGLDHLGEGFEDTISREEVRDLLTEPMRYRRDVLSTRVDHQYKDAIMTKTDSGIWIPVVKRIKMNA